MKAKWLTYHAFMAEHEETLQEVFDATKTDVTFNEFCRNEYAEYGENYAESRLADDRKPYWDCY